MARRYASSTRLEIVQAATTLFLDNGFSNTSAKLLCDQLNISTGNLTFYFPTKEHLLAVLVEMLCDFQKVLAFKAARGGAVRAICLEVAAMAAICDEDPVAKDFYLSSYTHPITLEIIRRSDADKNRELLQGYCLDWDEARFQVAETLVSGVEYATLMTTEPAIPLDERVRRALHAILAIYQVPSATRQEEIEAVLAMDYRELGRSFLRDFKQYLHEQSDHAFEEFMEMKRRRQSK